MLRSWLWLALHLAATAAQIVQNGEEVCENGGLDPSECAAVGCCQYDNGKCWSAVGAAPCSSGSGGSSDASLPEMPSPSTSLTVEACDKPGSGLSFDQKNALTSRDFTKCCFGAFNVLVTGTSDYPDAYMLTACVTVAELLDQNKDGVADDPAVVAKLSFLEAGGSAPVLQGAPTQAQEREGDALGEDGFGYSFSLQTWHCADGGCGHEVARKIITEEAFHMITQFGYSQAYPAQMGMDDFTSSIACREMAAAECVYWMHPENTCPNPGSHSQPPLIGTCNDAGCDCVEWYHQVVLILAGQEPAWMADFIPRSPDGLRATLSSEFLEMVADPAYHQLQAPLTYTYLLSDGPACPANCKPASRRRLHERRLLFAPMPCPDGCEPM